MYVSSDKHDYPEVWRRVRIEAKRGWYEVSTYGNVRHVWDSKRKTPMKPYVKAGNHKGSDYLVVKMSGKEVRIATVIYETFRGAIPEGMRIVHKNLNKEDNSILNLKLMTREEIGRKYGGLSMRRQRTVARVDLNGNVVDTYRSARQAAKEYGCISYQTILDRCNRRLRNAEDVWLPDGTTFVWED